MLLDGNIASRRVGAAQGDFALAAGAIDLVLKVNAQVANRLLCEVLQDKVHDCVTIGARVMKYRKVTKSFSSSSCC